MNYYKILNCSPNASQQDIRKCYRQMALKYHPDKNPHRDTNKYFKMVNEKGIKVIMEALNERNTIVEREVKIITTKGTRTGAVKRFSDRGGIVIKNEEGKIEEYTSGSLELLKEEHELNINRP